MAIETTTRPRDLILAPITAPIREPILEPILEPWRILALALIVAAGMLFVHLVVPAETGQAAAAEAVQRAQS